MAAVQLDFSTALSARWRQGRVDHPVSTAGVAAFEKCKARICSDRIANYEGLGARTQLFVSI